MTTLGLNFRDRIAGLGDAVLFLGRTLGAIFRGRVRWGEVWKQVYEQGVESALIVAVTSWASGAVLALQGFVVLSRFGAKEYVANLVALSLVREISPVFTAFIFSGKSGAKMAAELGSMNVNDQVLATRTLGVNPIEFLIVPRLLGCFLIFPGLCVFSEVIGIAGGYMIGVSEGGIPGATYWHQTLRAIRYVDFFSGFLKTFFFAVIISWVCCYLGLRTSGGSLGVGRFTTKAVALCYFWVVVANLVLTKLILAFGG